MTFVRVDGRQDRCKDLQTDGRTDGRTDGLTRPLKRGRKSEIAASRPLKLLTYIGASKTIKISFAYILSYW